MEILENNGQLSAWRKLISETVGFVPTMGALHEGHAALIRRSVRENKATIVSIFVNPMQFGPQEDLARYPRPWEKDVALCDSLGVDAIYHPDVKDMYPAGFCSRVEVTGIQDHWCGASRPGHFSGVATVVLKLMSRARADVMYLGQKDAQQAALLKRMALDLDLPTRVEVCPTIREADGLALSSRNQYLSPEERRIAPALQENLAACARAVEEGELNPRALMELFTKGLLRTGPWKLDYFGVADPVTMAPVDVINQPVRLLVAAFLGKTRLIDNLAANPSKK
jgi:pantoate--beta-alanine ligase